MSAQKNKTASTGRKKTSQTKNVWP